MHITILLPHWKTGKMSAYSVAQLLKYKGSHSLDIIIINNSPLHESVKYLEPFAEDILVIEYPQERLQSHGIAFDYVLPLVKTDYFITVESDSFPTKEGWLDYYERLIKEGYDCAASLLKLSGGEYHHPCGALYKTANWREAKEFCDKFPYLYFPNMSMRDDFACHCMVHVDMVEKFLENPDDYIELSDGYRPYTKELANSKLSFYKPTTAPFHNGVGCRQESVRTYGFRTVESEAQTIFPSPKMKIVNRIGAEPGQWFSWWHHAMEKKVFNVPTEVKWIEGKEGHQQEYTLMENGFYHIWGVSAYHGTNLNDSDIARIKQALPEQFYETLPDYQKIKPI